MSIALLHTVVYYLRLVPGYVQRPMRRTWAQQAAYVRRRQYAHSEGQVAKYKEEYALYHITLWLAKLLL